MADIPVEDVVEISPNGDVILIINRGDAEKRLRVSSEVLKAASPVFQSMLSPPYREAMDLLENGEVTIPLPEDDGQLLEIIMTVVHDPSSSRRVYKVNGVDKPKKMLPVLMAAHKYNFLDRTESGFYGTVLRWTRMVTHFGIKMHDYKELWELVFVSLILGNPALFEHSVFHLVRGYHEFFIQLAMDYNGEYEPLLDTRFVVALASFLENARYHQLLWVSLHHDSGDHLYIPACRVLLDERDYWRFKVAPAAWPDESGTVPDLLSRDLTIVDLVQASGFVTGTWPWYRIDMLRTRPKWRKGCWCHGCFEQIKELDDHKCPTVPRGLGMSLTRWPGAIWDVIVQAEVIRQGGSRPGVNESEYACWARMREAARYRDIMRFQRREIVENRWAQWFRSHQT